MEQQTVSLKQCISEVTSKQIAMNGKDFIYLIDKTKVEDEVLSEAVVLQKQKEDEAHNNEILSQIATKESELVRPMRELLSTTATAEAKAFAQSKVDEIELAIQELREELK